MKASETAANNSSFNISDLAELFKNGMDSNSPLSEKKGIGNWVRTAYGKIRLLSRESGTKDLNKILMALEVEINPNIIIENPSLKINQSQNVKDLRLFIPLSLPLDEEKGLTYQKEAIFPFFLTLKEIGHSVFISVDFSVQYCIQNDCKTELNTVPLYILAEHNYFTPFSAFIENSFKFVPLGATQDQIQMGALSKNTFWIMLQLPESIDQPKFLLLDTQTSTPIFHTQIQSNLNNGRALFIFRTQENIINKTVLLYFSDKKQLFTQVAKITEKPLPYFSFKNKGVMPPFYLWLVFLLFSPCLCLLLQQKPRNEIMAKQDTIKNILGIVFGILCGIFIYSAIPYAILSHSILWLSFGFLLFGFLGFFSHPITHFGYGLLTAIVPVFFFLKSIDIQTPSTFNELTCFFCVLAILNVLPFAVFLLKPYWLVKMGKTFEKQPKYKLRFSFFLDALLFGLMCLFILF